MLTDDQIEKIKEHLERAQNPLFFFDNDQDGLCSFLLLQRYISRGKGIPVKSFPDLSVDYFRRVRELNADYIFILDRSIVSREFFEEVSQNNIPVVCIDHHKIEGVYIPDFVDYFNPDSDINEAVSAFCYQVTKRDLWISIVGCISDAFIPDFYEEFKEKYPDLTIDSNDALDIYYESEIGRLAQILGAGLKDKTTNVVGMMKFLMKVETPYEVLEENNKTSVFHKRFNEINKKYQKFLMKAEDVAKNSDKILFFDYGGNMSISADLANGLKHKFPDKIIVVGYISGAKINVSIRGKNVKEKILRVIGNFDGATGGGHDDAVGARLNSQDWERFKERFREEIE
ncbi:MAG: DHH family phosphoesterase [archaeon]